MKLKESAKNAKREPRDLHQNRYTQSQLALLATDSLEQNYIKQPSKITHKNIIIRIKMVFLQWYYVIIVPSAYTYKNK